MAITLVAAVTIVFVYLDQSFKNVDSPIISISAKENPYVTEYSLPSDSAPNGLVVDKAGLVWVASKNATLYSVDPISGQVKHYEIKSTSSGNMGPNSTTVWTIVQDTDGKIWLSPFGTMSIWR
ncbi:MAG TPA: two-component regulator propeller domain-containing protein, partial [Candidatus Nitrosotalea sp.]|nr:two-component regulator propeller domain-containing protein [Candidatus Nitrosotalea sp.]